MLWQFLIDISLQRRQNETVYSFLVEKQREDKVHHKLNIGHFFRFSRVKKMIERHESLLIRSIQFIDHYSDKEKN